MNIMKYRNIFFSISLAFLIPSLYFLVSFGLLPSIDFAGGSLLEISIQTESELSEEIVLEAIHSDYEVTNVAQKSENKFVIEGENISNDQKVISILNLESKIGAVTELRFEAVGPTISRELLVKTLTALFIVAGVITLYVWKQFSELKYGVCAIIAMFHDSIILMGAFSILGYFYGVKVDVLFVTALLTTLSFSVHDTIVVYDRIRELKKKNSGIDYEVIVNMAVVETLSRSINNSVTIIIMLSSLALLGGESIKWFALALLIGAVTGTYSSTFTAAPLLLLWNDISAKIQARKTKKK